MKKSFTSSSWIRKSWIFCLIAVVHVGAAGQTTHMIGVTSNVFTPDEITINVGDTVLWTNTAGFHNVNGTQATYPLNPESFGNSTGTGWTYSHVFTVSGEYDYQCDPHVGLGMVGTITVMEVPMDTLTINFTGMTPHVGQMLTLYVRELPSGKTLDTLVVDAIENADFSLQSYVIQSGTSYVLDFYADHNENGMYDAPPTDHAWRVETGEAIGNLVVEFTHNTNFTDIMSNIGPDIQLMDDSVLGSILTDGGGYTLYYFTKDALPDTSLCVGGCVTNWPLFYAENPELGEGLDLADFSSITHPEGEMQTTYKGWPLYYFVNDLNPGETEGEAVGNVWFVAKPDYSVMLLDGLLIGKDSITYTGSYEPGEEMVQFFVDENGKTLYIFINDTYNQNNFTASDFGNDAVWPIYEEVLQSVASTLDRSLFDSIDVFGRQQLTYNGWPLYYFGNDANRGETTGVSVPNPGVWPVAVAGLEAPVASSVDEFESKLGLRLYPNPVVDVLNIISNETIGSISIINVMGARIQSLSNIHSTDYQISLEGIGPGVYFLEVTSTENKTEISRLIKK